MLKRQYPKHIKMLRMSHPGSSNQKKAPKVDPPHSQWDNEVQGDNVSQCVFRVVNFSQSGVQEVYLALHYVPSLILLSANHSNNKIYIHSHVTKQRKHVLSPGFSVWTLWSLFSAVVKFCECGALVVEGFDSDMGITLPSLISEWYNVLLLWQSHNAEHACKVELASITMGAVDSVLAFCIIQLAREMRSEQSFLASS